MKVAILSESEADKAAVHIFVNALLGENTELFPRPFRVHGWTTVFGLLPIVVKELHYNTDVDALAIVLDSDKSTPHLSGHDTAQSPIEDCRLCKLREVVRSTRNALKDTGRPPLKIAIGLAVPCIEAWLRCGHDAGVTEAAWLVAVAELRFPYDSLRLKREVYGTERPSRELESRRMQEEARRLAVDIERLVTWFPNGFGPFATAVRGWR
jgi:hypothetical protein